MSLSESQLVELKRAYQTLGIPLTASAFAIKQTYRQLAKRWHPDVYPSGTVAHNEATRMMRLINEAYSMIAHAPLRYHVESYQRVWDERTHGVNVEFKKPRADTLPINRRVEFCVRFGFGAFVGFLVSTNFVDLPQKAFFFISACLIALFGFLAVGYGDRFWSKLLEWW